MPEIFMYFFGFYCVICYLIAFGLELANHKNEPVSLSTGIFWLFSPIWFPILIGYRLNE